MKTNNLKLDYNIKNTPADCALAGEYYLSHLKILNLPLDHTGSESLK